MSPAWMLQAILAGALLGAGALAAERVAGWFGVPRRSVCSAAMLASLALPALSLLAPGLLPDLGIVPRPPAEAAAPVAALVSSGDLPLYPGATEPTSLRIDFPTILGLGWLAASLAMLGTVAWTYRRLRVARRAWVSTEVDGARVLVAERAGPAVVGLLRPVIVLPRSMIDLPDGERRLVILHEREHVAAGDAWLLFLGTLAVAAMPWSLPLWWQHRRLRAAVETDCDARVLARGASPLEYGRVLIRTAGSIPGLPLPGPAWGDSTLQLERRIMSMTAKRPSHRLLRSLPLLAVTAVVAAAACDVVGDGAAETPSGLAAAPDGPSPSARFDTVMVDTVAARRLVPAPSSSIGLRPAFPVRLAPESRRSRIRMMDPFKVGEVRVGGGAWKAGLRPGDVVLTFDGQDSREFQSLVTLKSKQPGTRYVMRVRRGAEEREVTAVLDPPGNWP